MIPRPRLALLECFIALVLLVVTLPVLLGSVILLRAFSDTTVILIEEGKGYDGTRFQCYRLRTTGHGETFAFLHMGRVTRDWLVDRLPGLLSVMLGHISLKNYLDLLR